MRGSFLSFDILFRPQVLMKHRCSRNGTFRKTEKAVLNDVLCDASTKVEALVSTKADELKVLVTELIGAVSDESFNDKIQGINEQLSGIKGRLHGECTDILGLVKAHTARVEALEAQVTSGLEGVKKLQSAIDGTCSNINGIVGSVGILSKSVEAINEKLDSTQTKLNTIDS